MKKIFTIAMCLLAAVLISVPSYSQKKKKETNKERKERIAKITNDGAAKKDLFIFITRSFNKNNNFNFNYQTISAATAEYYIDLKRDRISCCLPFTGLAETKSSLNLLREQRVQPFHVHANMVAQCLTAQRRVSVKSREDDSAAQINNF